MVMDIGRNAWSSSRSVEPCSSLSPGGRTCLTWSAGDPGHAALLKYVFDDVGIGLTGYQRKLFLGACKWSGTLQAPRENFGRRALASGHTFCVGIRDFLGAVGSDAGFIALPPVWKFGLKDRCRK